MNALQLDLRYAFRQMARSPLLTMVIVLTLALGIGANTTVFSLANSALLKPLPYADADRIVQLTYKVDAADPNSSSFSVPEYFDYRSQNRTLASLSEYHTLTFTLLGGDEPERVQTGVVSAEFFDTLGIKPFLGRTFRPGEDRMGAPPVLVLSHDFWRRRLRGDPAIVGKVLRMNGRSLTVVGVLPPLPQFPGEDDLYISVPACPFRSSDHLIHERSGRLLTLFGRLKRGVTLEQAQADVATISRRLRQAYPADYSGTHTADAMWVSVRELLVSKIRPTLYILLATVALVLLIACANLANLTLARLVRREREVVLRVAVGAGRGRLIRQILTESLLLSLLGGALGLALAAAGSGAMVSFARLFTPRVQDIEIDVRVLVFTLLVSVLTGLVFGLIPALQMTRRNLVTSLKEGGTSTVGLARQRFRGSLIVVQVALAFVLLTGAGLMVRSLHELQGVKGGYDPANILTLRVTLPFSKYRHEKAMNFFQRLLAEVRRYPAVRSVAVGSNFPLYGQQTTPALRVEGETVGPHEEPPRADWLIVSPEYFKTLSIPLLAGRVFGDNDRDGGQPVVVVSRSLARRHWPGQSPLGRRISSGSFGNVWFTVVGVVDDVRQARIDLEPSDTFYVSFLQAEEIDMSVLARTAGAPMRLVNDIRRAIHALDPDQPIADIQTLDEVRNRSLASSRLTAGLLVVFALLAFLIAAIGLSTVVAFVVGQRTPEIGVRMALGAETSDVLGLVLRQGMRLVIAGLILGAVAAFGSARFLASQLYGIAPGDLTTFIGVFCLLLLVALVACWIPARRATRIDPLIALRSS